MQTPYLVVDYTPHETAITPVPDDGQSTLTVRGMSHDEIAGRVAMTARQHDTHEVRMPPKGHDARLADALAARGLRVVIDDGEIRMPLVALIEGRPYTPGPDEHVITDDHSIADIVRHAVAQAGASEVRDILDGIEGEKE